MINPPTIFPIVAMNKFHPIPPNVISAPKTFPIPKTNILAIQCSTPITAKTATTITFNKTFPVTSLAA